MLGIVTDDLRIPGEVAAVLRYYVYALSDPRNGRVFYIGKGIGDRINAHTRDAGKTPNPNAPNSAPSSTSKPPDTPSNSCSSAPTSKTRPPPSSSNRPSSTPSMPTDSP